MNDGALRSQAERLAKIQRRERNRMARQGEGDRHSTAALPKHLFSGKEVLVLPIDVDEGIRDKYLVFLLFSFFS